MPPIVLSIVSIISLVAKGAPEVEKIYAAARDLFNSLFSGGLITKAQQDALMDWSDKHMVATLAGEVPPEFQVEPNPS